MGHSHLHLVQWFQLQWPEDWHTIHIAAKELVPVVLTAALWGPHWTRQRISFRSDNMAVVEFLKSGTSHDPLLMHLLRCLAFYSAYYCFQISVEHIPGVLNTAADAISRNNMSLFHSLVPQIQPVALPRAVVDFIVERGIPSHKSSLPVRLATLLSPVRHHSPTPN